MAINPWIKNLCKEIIIGDYMDIEFVKDIAKKIYPDFVVIWPENPISNGTTDVLAEIWIKTFAPTKKCAQLESSKSFTRKLLEKYNIDASPDFLVLKADSNNIKEQMMNFYNKFDWQIVVKSDGLLWWKWVIVAGDHFDNFHHAYDFAIKSIEKFGKVVLEEKLLWEEFSLISIVDGETVLDTPVIQDHKRAFEGDTWPNTWWMWCISDENNLLPFINEKTKQKAHQITEQVMKAIEKETWEKFVWVMYGGFMLTKSWVKLIEYNVRFWDPEALNILPILKTDFVEVCQKAISRDLKSIGKLDFEKKATVLKYLCPDWYPVNPVKNQEIVQTKKDLKNIYFASVAEENWVLVEKWSRAIWVLWLWDSLEKALDDCEQKIKYFKWPLFYRKDIGTKQLIQKRIDHLKQLWIL